MDSVTVLYEALRTYEVVACLSFDYGSKHNAKEIPFAKLHAERHGIPHHAVSLDFMDRLFKSDLLKSGGEIPDGHYAEASMKQTVVPFRNGIMLAVAAGYAESIEADAVVIAAHSGDHAIYPDCREPFMQAMGQAIEQGTYVGIQLLRPFIDMDKTSIARRGVELGVDLSGFARPHCLRADARVACIIKSPEARNQRQD
jgi:7-cyano-7-deazaguanine synthase